MGMSTSLNKRFIFLYIVLAATAALVFSRQRSIVPTVEPFSVFPQEIDGWSMTSNVVFTDNIINVLRPSDYLSRGYTDKQNRFVSLYVGYHDGDKSGPLHSPRLCLPGGGWNEVSAKRATLTTDVGELPMVQSVYRKGEQKLLILYWFRIAGMDLDNLYKLKFYEFAYSFLHRRKDTALIRVEVPIRGNEPVALDAANGFIKSIYPLVVEHLPKSPT
jgi:EpsI family protein